jgi:hypothetical protein
MSNTLGDLMEKNLIEVFGQRDSARREVAIAGIYTADCTFFEAEERIVGRDALNAKIERIRVHLHRFGKFNSHFKPIRPILRSDMRS